MTESSWVSAHVFRHDDLDELLLTQVAPLMSELVADDLVLGFFYLRYWEGGPHVRLRMRAATAHLGEVRERVSGRLGAYLRAEPSRHPMNPADYTRLAADLAALEGHLGYERRLLPPDTIRFVPYPPEHLSFGHGASLASVEHHFCESTAVALDVLWAPPPERVSAAMVMTLAALLSLPADARLLKQAGTMTNSPEPDTSDATEEKAAWARSRNELTAMAERLRTADLSITPQIPALAWARSIRELRDRLAALRLAGAFSSEFPEPVAHALDRCLHLHLNRLGISLTQEARLRRMAVLTLRDLR
ncbi:thiopeptide-type bacteriocin biosynthesis protein [Nonomuraea sp. ZG12]|uniref:thiopeptide-type bacteriocin biosynthesis protein n=1 Tax=Nonomuraea sp. ZG12 TaxID=3452207 RepID=UPI003F8CB959